jgi:SAM-dependent methyltransferase
MTTRVDYDDVAAVYERRYTHNQFAGTEASLLDFVGDDTDIDVGEVGCGSGHWLAVLANRARRVAGLDPSDNMLAIAQRQASVALLVRGRAEALPWASASLDRVFAIHALQHFADKDAFAREARRVLRPGGAIMSIALDPNRGVDQWWVYDYFPAAIAADRARYPSTAAIRELFARAGFSDATTSVAQHLPAEVPFTVAVKRGILDRRSTSQLMVISDADYEAGRAHLERDQPVLRADLRLYMTVARVAES